MLRNQCPDFNLNTIATYCKKFDIKVTFELVQKDETKQSKPLKLSPIQVIEPSSVLDLDQPRNKYLAVTYQILNQQNDRDYLIKTALVQIKELAQMLME